MCRWRFCLYCVGTERLLVIPIHVLQQLIHTAEYHFPWVVTIGKLTSVYFRHCPCIPITKSITMSAWFSFMICVLIITRDTGTSHEHDYWTQIICQLVCVHPAHGSPMFQQPLLKWAVTVCNGWNLKPYCHKIFHSKNANLKCDRLVYVEGFLSIQMIFQYAGWLKHILCCRCSKTQCSVHNVSLHQLETYRCTYITME
jgi:hypothetical protein